ncbi:DUF362 domain-containing protein [Caldisericum exile]|uniref:4Fe-4S ferredoxin-type domain-containing protein n=1 Tax=Caldisericum exile (strain DSM 21853 / NBRC 104410 / AZM16c01) TaxID=511051 RepID=A0A7U6GEM4_CALEA|nr:DUF362 domain-containing protein [Caldisericum exile]BAL80993.1 hypothetical protein CSE_08670 [Caldisericum exile AZM16c01]
MSTVRIVEEVQYNKESLRKKLIEVLDWVNFDEIKDKNILVFFDFPTPDNLVIYELKNFLKEKGVAKVEFGTSILTHKQRELISNLLENGITVHDFRNEPYEEFAVDLKSKKNEHYFGYKMLSPAQYQAEKAFENSDIFKVRTLKKVYIPEAIANSDYIIPIIKIKDSPVGKIGGFINSLLYIVPTNIRSEILLKNLSMKFADSLLDVYGVIKKSVLFGLVDAVNGDLTHTEEDNFGLLLSSNDLLALDSVISVLVGFRSSDIESNKLGSVYDLGHGLLKEIVIDGADFLKLRKELTKKLKFSKFFGKKVTPSILEQTKELDTISLFCPTGAIIKEDSQYKIDKSKCINCNFCVELSPEIFGS